MSIWSLFNITTLVKRDKSQDFGHEVNGQPDVASHSEERQSAFVTAQSLTSFAGGTGAVTLIWQTIAAISPDTGKSMIVGMVSAIIVGSVLYLIGESDPDLAPRSTRDRLIALFVATLNTMVLYSAAIGARGLFIPSGAGS